MAHVFWLMACYRGPMALMNMRILHLGANAQQKGDSRNLHGANGPCELTGSDYPPLYYLIQAT